MKNILLLGALIAFGISGILGRPSVAEHNDQTNSKDRVCGYEVRELIYISFPTTPLNLWSLEPSLD